MRLARDKRAYRGCFQWDQPQEKCESCSYWVWGLTRTGREMFRWQHSGEHDRRPALLTIEGMHRPEEIYSVYGFRVLEVPH